MLKGQNTFHKITLSDFIALLQQQLDNNFIFIPSFRLKHNAANCTGKSVRISESKETKKRVGKRDNAGFEEDV